MALRAGHGNGAGVPRIEVLPADEQPKQVAAPVAVVTRPVHRRQDGRLADSASAAAHGRRGVRRRRDGCDSSINDGPHCVQWALVERSNDGTPRADHPPKWAGALSNLARALHLHAINHSQFLLSRRNNDAGARIDYFEPTIFIKTPRLWLYDLATHSLAETPRLTLAQYFEVAGGKQEHRMVDVVASVDIAHFADRYRRVRANLETLIESHGAELLELAEQQRKRWRVTLLRRKRRRAR